MAQNRERGDCTMCPYRDHYNNYCNYHMRPLNASLMEPQCMNIERNSDKND